jgi:hypothetical protein
VAIAVVVSGGAAAEAGPQRILLDTDMDTDRRLARATLHPQAEPLRVRPRGTLAHDPSVFPCSLLCYWL